MIHSMTAFARIERTCAAGALVCEIRSLNSKNLDVFVRLPQGFSDREDAVKKAVAGRVVRGRVEIVLVLDAGAGASNAYVVDSEAADGYYAGLCRLRDRLGLSGPIDIGLIASAPGVIRVVQQAVDSEAVWPEMMAGIEEAIEAMCAMRAREGAFLQADFEKRLGQIEGFLEEITRASEGLLQWYQQRFVERIGLLVENQATLDPMRVAQEAAFLAVRSDITEELTRLNGHIAHFRSIMQEKEASGRKLNFLIQEMHREITTLGSKTEKAAVTHRVVDIKAELDKLREQVQNVE